MIRNSDSLQTLQETVSAIEAGGNVLQVRRADLGFVATLRTSRLELLLTGSHGVKIVSLDLSDPANDRFLKELAQGVHTLDLHSIEEAIVRSACLVKAMTDPVLSKLRNGGESQVRLGLEINDRGQAKSLTTAIIGQEPSVKEEDGAIMAAITKTLADQVGPKSLGLEFRANRLSYYSVPKEDRAAFQAWLMAPVGPLAKPHADADRFEPAPEIKRSFQNILNEEPSEWKRLLWPLIEGDLSCLRNFDLSVLRGDQEKRDLLQALIDDMAQEGSPPWLRAP